eukprot:PITA_30423
MDHVLQKVTGSFRMSILDGFFGYNQVVVDKEDQKKTAFTTPWGTFMYPRMPFGLMNAGATFQRAMDISFLGDKFVVIYLDDIIVFSMSYEEHLDHLKKAFKKCRKFGLSLNPKKSIFALEEGKLLGHTASRDGKNNEGKEKPVAFFSKFLRDVELKYNILEKQDVLVQSDVKGKSGKWIAKIQEYDLDIKPTKLVKGRGLAKMLTKSNFQALGINLLTPVNEEIIEECEENSNPVCQKCQRFAEKKRLAPLPLIPAFIEESFKQWGLDFVGEINPPSNGQHKWVLTTTDYFTKWVEAILTKKVNDQVVMKFLEENIFSRFGCPIKIIIGNAQVFSSIEFVSFCRKYNVILSHSIAYHPQGNGLVESTNKTLMKILKKTIAENQKDWDSKLKLALWVVRETTKRSTGKSPFELVYGTQDLFPSQLLKLVIAMIQEAKEEPNALIRRMHKVVELSESRDKVINNLIMYQSKMKGIFDKKAKEIDFKVGGLVLRWNTRREYNGKHGKFDPLWYGPFRIIEAWANNTFFLENLDGEAL